MFTAGYFLVKYIRILVTLHCLLRVYNEIMIFGNRIFYQCKYWNLGDTKTRKKAYCDFKTGIPDAPVH